MRALRNIFAAVGFGLATLAAVTLSAIALTVPAQYSPRVFQTQQTHYIRFTFNFNSCVIPAGAAVCTVKVGALPYNAFLTAVHWQIITVFNPTTSATISLGTTSTAATNIKAALNVFTGQATTAGLDTAFAGAGELVTGSGAASTGADGGFDLYATYTTGANGSQGTTGQIVFILEYIGPNDGSCAPVPLGSTATAC
jgi:hypothetical protein